MQSKYDRNRIKNADEMVNSPKHYNSIKISGKHVEVIDIINCIVNGFNLSPAESFKLANMIKYTCRFPFKGKPVEDIEKSLWYLSKLVDELSKYKNFDYPLYQNFILNGEIADLHELVNGVTDSLFTNTNNFKYNQAIKNQFAKVYHTLLLSDCHKCTFGILVSTLDELSILNALMCKYYSGSDMNEK